MRPCLCALVLSSRSRAAAGARDLPSWWECSSCALCRPEAGAGASDVAPSPELHNSRGACPLCTGCTHHLELLNLTVRVEAGGEVRFVSMHTGNTGASLFLAVDAAGESSVLKLHGVVTPMVSAGKLGQLLQLYRGRRYLGHEMLLARALTSLADECGLGEVNLRETVGFVRAVVPVTGEKVEEARAVLSEHARGASLEKLTLKLTSAQLLSALGEIRHEAVRDGALFDLLFTQGDRHSENLFIDGSGYFKLIDSRDAAIDDGLDSIFFATTWSFERNRVGNEHMYNHSKAIVNHHWPQTTMDYRCHVAGGEIGRSYPPQFERCLTKWAAMTPDAFVSEYFAQALEDALVVNNGTGSAANVLGSRPRQKAERVIQQASRLLTLGFEETLRLTAHKNATGRVPTASGFPPHPPCCRVQQAEPGRGYYQCPGEGEVLPALALPSLSPVANRAAWQQRVGEDIVRAGGDVFDAVPASGFDPAFKNPCWRNSTGLFCIPYFHIIGVSKCGTTDLYRRLSLHPHVAPSRNKGPHFWDESHSMDWYLRLYDFSVSFIQQEPGRAVIGDASSNTLTYSGIGVRNDRHPPANLPTVLAALQPALRLVAVLRNPVDRLYSSFYYYGHYTKRFGADAAGFHKFAQAQLAAYADACPAAATPRACSVTGYSHAEQLTKGLYSQFLPDYFAAFPRQQLLVLRSEDYGADVGAGVASVMAHIGLEPPTEEVWASMVSKERSNSRRRNGQSRGGSAGEMLPETRRLLIAFYREHNEALAELLGDPRYLRWNSEEPEDTSVAGR